MAKIYATRRPQNGSITIYYIHKQEKKHFFTGEVIRDPKYWDKDAGCAVEKKSKNKKTVRDAPNVAEINQRIAYHKAIIEQIKTDLIREGSEPTTSLVAERYANLKGQREAATKELETGITANKLVIFSADNYSEDDAKKKQGLAWDWWRAGKGIKKPWKHSTKQGIKESLEAFEAFAAKIKSSRSLLKSDLSMATIQDYEDHLFETGHIKNHVGKRLKHLRQFLQSLDGLAFNPAKIKIYQIEKTPIALTDGELTKIEAVSLDGELMNHCRDMFLLGCYTSLRVSDLLKLNAQHFHGNDIRILQEKNEKHFKFPITPQIRRILEKYQYKLPKVSDAEINKNIKEVARLAGIDQPVELTKELRDKTVRYTKKKHEIIGTHMAVKTFITLALSWGISIPDIAAVVGKHVRTIQGHYAAGDKEGAAERLRELWEQRTHLKVV